MLLSDVRPDPPDTPEPSHREGARTVDRSFGEPLLTVAEVANIMRVSNMTVYRLIKSGQLSAIRVGKNYRIRRGDIDRYLTERAVRIED